VSTESPSTARQRERERAHTRNKNRRRAVTWIVRVVAAAVVFFAGLAVGRALESGSGSGATNTSIRTLVPETLTPQQTVTVTVSTP
jgi:anti-sigma factor RsiW